MTTNRIAVLFVIVFLAFTLTACGETGSLTNLVASASNDTVTVQSVRTSARVETCDFGSTQNLINAVKAERDASTGKVEGIALDQWLTNKMSAFACISPLSTERN